MRGQPSFAIPVARGPVVGSIRPPGSKSLTNRALILAALARGPSTLTGVLASDDTRVMIDSLQRLGLDVQHDLATRCVTLTGCGGRWPATQAELWLENSGTSIRFLTAACALGHGQYRLDGNARMRERPIADLVAGLQGLGVHVECALATQCPPVTMHAQGLSGGHATIAANVSSQFLSALLMVAPCASGEVTLDIAGELVSQPYVAMTLQAMAAFGGHVQVDGTRFVIQPQSYRGTQYGIEPDASAASYFFAAAAITGGRVTVQGLHRGALQGDVEFVSALARMGCAVEWGPDQVTVTGGPLSGIEIDMNAISDTAQTLAVVAAFAAGATRIRGVQHMRFKETDRVTAVVTELRRMGLAVDEHDDGMTIHPGPLHGAEIHTYDDHRMAMSFALAGLRVPGVVILDPGCTAKTYPHYFADLLALVSA